MVEEIICAGLQCFGQYFMKGLEAILQLASSFGGSGSSKKQNNGDVET